MVYELVAKGVCFQFIWMKGNISNENDLLFFCAIYDIRTKEYKSNETDFVLSSEDL